MADTANTKDNKNVPPTTTPTYTPTPPVKPATPAEEEAPVVDTNTYVHVAPGFRGSWKTYIFDDDGISDRELEATDVAAFKQQFPKFAIAREVLEESED
jgi:hypothetical protein